MEYNARLQRCVRIRSRAASEWASVRGGSIRTIRGRKHELPQDLDRTGSDLSAVCVATMRAWRARRRSRAARRRRPSRWPRRRRRSRRRCSTPPAPTRRTGCTRTAATSRRATTRARRSTPTNVGKLKPAFVFQTAVLESMETAPIVVDGVMFLTTSFNHVYAIDAVDGRGILALQAQDGPDRDRLLRQQQPRRRDRGRHGCSWARSTPSSSRSTPRPASCCGKRRSPIPRRAIRRRWRPRSSTARC